MTATAAMTATTPARRLGRLAASSLAILTLPLLALAGCASAPVATPEPASSGAVSPMPTMLVTSSGVVIGTFSYQYVKVDDAAGNPGWVLHFTRMDAPGQASQDYAMVVDVDPSTRRGVFTGTLPAGVYAFREAASTTGHYTSAALRLPFEVQAGSVQDAGHYALNPFD
jgi:hypothetical protein